MPTDVPVLVKMAVLTPMTLPEESCGANEVTGGGYSASHALVGKPIFMPRGIAGYNI